MNVKQRTKTPREYESRTCESCGGKYTAPKRIRGGGVVGDGKCADCISTLRPAHKMKCPVCNKPIHVQAGHKRETCSRDCQKILTLRRRADRMQTEQVGDLQRRADDLFRQKQADEMAELRRLNEAAQAENARLESERRAASSDAAREQRKNDRLTAPLHSGRGSRLDRLAAVSGRVRADRKTETDAPAPVAA